MRAVRTPMIALGLALLSGCSGPTLAPTTPKETPTAELPVPEGAPTPMLEVPRDLAHDHFTEPFTYRTLPAATFGRSGS